jgi:hypothetical protein
MILEARHRVGDRDVRERSDGDGDAPVDEKSDD